MTHLSIESFFANGQTRDVKYHRGWQGFLPHSPPPCHSGFKVECQSNNTALRHRRLHHQVLRIWGAVKIELISTTDRVVSSRPANLPSPSERESRGFEHATKLFFAAFILIIGYLNPNSCLLHFFASNAFLDGQEGLHREIFQPSSHR